MANSTPLLLGYLMHYPLTRYWQQFYFSRIVRTLEAPIPQQDACLVTPNHQNAFVDAYTVAPLYDDQMRFMTRSDVFKNPLFARFIQSHGLTPIYRERDGRDALEKNDEVFDGTTRLLTANGKVLIFPEANCVVEKRIRTIKKGTARMAFLALKALEPGRKLWLIPTGIWYNLHTETRQPVLVKSGTPIDVGALRLEAGSEARALLQLTRLIEEKLKELNLSYPEDFPAGQLDVFFDLAAAARLRRPRFRNAEVIAWFDLHNRLNNGLTSLSVEEKAAFLEDLEAFEQARSAAGLPLPAFDPPRSDGSGWLMQLALLPLAVAGTWMVQPALAAGAWFQRKAPAERQFITSSRFLGGMFSSFYWWLFNSVVAGLVFGGAGFFGAWLAAPLLSWLELHRRDAFAGLSARRKFARGLVKGEVAALEARRRHAALMAWCERLLTRPDSA